MNRIIEELQVLYPMKKEAVLHPHLLAIFPVIYVNQRYAGQFSFLSFLEVIGFTLALSVVLYFFLFRLIKEQRSVGVFLSLGWMWFFSYSAVREVVFDMGLGWGLFRHRYFVLIWLANLLLFLYCLSKVKRDHIPSINRFMNVFSSILLCITILVFVHNVVWEKDPLRESSSVPRNVGVQSSGTEQYDIYYIVLDAYTASDALRKYLGFDNSNFLEFLRTKGFFIAESSCSNYAWTKLSMASSLNIDFLEADTMDHDSTDFKLSNPTALPHLILDNKVRKILESRGYEFVDLSISDLFAQSGSKVGQKQASHIAIALLKMTVFSKPMVENYLEVESKRQSIMERLVQLKEVVQRPELKFVYAHFLIPHQPYVFDSSGSHQSFLSGLLEPLNEKELYIRQLQFTNKVAMEIVNEIIEKGKREAIIILQGDHGINLGTTREESIKLRMSILNAYHLPGNGEQLLYARITPVNTFRLIFDRYFGHKLGRLEDRSYYSTVDSYRLTDVTSLLE